MYATKPSLNLNNDIVDESLTSMLVRKMKIGRRNHHQHNHNQPTTTEIFHKKISKITKKEVESGDLIDGVTKGCFINRYLDGYESSGYNFGKNML
ncbi:hypothetical protein BLA29_002242 [Euroglyphus maynei]|uniref:Uncharacterized protein n=1 Tax=Euroglyphus maynei TaxID=6958 RepID=A0A1Y3BVM7_EURMA|nr:hypothetical protein BLA29_002242 [Euroglyphus maynei]